MQEAWTYKIRGRVQGVGFRPFIWQLANALGLKGYVLNQSDGVVIHTEGKAVICKEFFDSLLRNKPEAAIIKHIERSGTEPLNLSTFEIKQSRGSNGIITEICPDIAVCPDCLEEMRSPGKRNGYPFINCTNCGPRFTLINDFPYDRQFTSMHKFQLCRECHTEYVDPENRRFHAQPTSCFSCGPEYEYFLDNIKITGFKLILERISQQIGSGYMVAVKSLGGYNLVCDATNDEAVRSIRKFKARDKKPLAVMFRNLETLKQAVYINKIEEDILQSWRRPIVILKQKANYPFSDEINHQLNSLGCFLPYLPLHYLLFDKLKTDAVVITSGNKTDSPIIYQEHEAFQNFENIKGGILVNNREILRRCDDSVVKVIHSSPQVIRRSRGYAPAPVELGFDAGGILATGAELSNCFCIGKAKQAILSQHIGDLKNAGTYSFFSENINEFSRIYRFKPDHIACDLHPDYFSSDYAARSGLPVTRVQHHHAHIASVMAEQGICGQIIGLAYDGTGLGTDGHIWGSEAFICDFKSFQRISHFGYIPLPGGDKVTYQPWRTALMYLVRAYPDNWHKLDIPFIKKLDMSLAGKLVSAAHKGINAPLSCSTGRLFDAIAALTMTCFESSYHSEAPMLIEERVMEDCVEAYNFTGNEIINFNLMIIEIIDDLAHNMPIPLISAKFHNTLAHAGYHQACFASRQSGLTKVVLSGGCFQNKVLTEKLVHLLEQGNFEVVLPGEAPANDGGLALGQLAVAAHKK